MVGPEDPDWGHDVYAVREGNAIELPVDVSPSEWFEDAEGEEAEE